MDDVQVLPGTRARIRPAEIRADGEEDRDGLRVRHPEAVGRRGERATCIAHFEPGIEVGAVRMSPAAPREAAATEGGPSRPGRSRDTVDFCAELRVVSIHVGGNIAPVVERGGKRQRAGTIGGQPDDEHVVRKAERQVAPERTFRRDSAIAAGQKSARSWGMRIMLGLCFLCGVSGAVRATETGKRFAGLSHWAVEQMPGGTVKMRGAALEIEDQAGCTVWWREKLTAPVAISYTVTAIVRGGPHDRASDVNCFWMANDSRSPAAPFAPGPARTGKFSDYDSRLTYYVGYGGNNNRTTRFRRYDGTAARPLLPAHDLSAPKFLLEPNRRFRIRLIARGGRAEFWRDGERIFTFTDPAPLTSGWFALRTVRSHLLIEDFKIEKLAAE